MTSVTSTGKIPYHPGDRILSVAITRADANLHVTIRQTVLETACELAPR